MGRRLLRGGMGSLVRSAFGALGLDVRRHRPTPSPEKPLPLQGTKVIQVGDFALVANESHALGGTWRRYPLYSLNLPRIATYLHVKYPQLEIIDVGANIGDTAALLRTAGLEDTIHAVEGVEEYYRLLVANAKKLGDVRPYRAFLGETSGVQRAAVIAASGTAKLAVGDSNIEHMTLGDFASRHSINGVRLLKLDTDGLDLAIIRGGLEWIAQNQPVLFFEYFERELRAVGDDGLSTLQDLRRIGYETALYYDNVGRFLCAASLANEALLRHLYGYTAGARGAFPYYDVCVFHSRDADVAAHAIAQEEHFFAAVSSER